MKTDNLILFILLGGMIFFFQCTKDKIEPSCIEIDQLTGMRGELLFPTTQPVINGFAYFNPNNSDEIIYRRADQTVLKMELIRYNLNTKEKKLIYQGDIYSRPRWGKNDWILLHLKDDLGYNIYKVKSNGDSLTALTTSGNCFFPEWDVASNKLIYELGFTNPTEFIISDSDGNIQDTVFVGVGSMGSWQHSELVANGTFKGLFLGNPMSNDYELIYETEKINQSGDGAEWLDEERVFWCHTTGIHITNITTEETEVIRETCNAHCYQRPTYAPDIDKIIVEKLERIKETETTGRAVVSVVMMNPDGTEEEEIIIPE